MDIVLRSLECFIVLSLSTLVFMGGYNYAIYDNDLIEMPTAMKIAKNLHAESGYNLHTYDCSNKTEELVRRLEQQGYDKVRYLGVKHNGTCHVIACYEQCIDYIFGMFCYEQCIESTQGIFINPYIDTNYSVNWSGCRY